MTNEFDFSHVVNTVSALIGLTITPLFLALISKTKNISIPKTIIKLTLLASLTVYGLMGLALLAMLLLSLRPMWRDILWIKNSVQEAPNIMNNTQ